MANYDLAGNIIAYEMGELDGEDILTLFSHLVKTGQAWTLQGSYGRYAAALIENGTLDREGNILIDTNESVDSDYCPHCGHHYFVHNDDGSCVQD